MTESAGSYMYWTLHAINQDKVQVIESQLKVTDCLKARGVVLLEKDW